jgi:hypothetical protein
MKLKYCDKCKNLWVFYKGHFSILRLDSGKKAKITSEKCYLCKIYEGGFDYSRLLELLEETHWSLDRDHRYGIFATHRKYKNVIFLLPKNTNQSDFSIKIRQLLNLLENVNPISINNIKDNLIQYLFFKH